MAGNNREARTAADIISRQEKRERWNCDAFLSLAPENIAEGTDVAAYRRAVSVANVIVMPLDEPSIASWQGLDDAGRRERILPFAEFLRDRYPRAQVLVFFVADNLVVAGPSGHPPRRLPTSPSAMRRCRWKKSSRKCWPLCRLRERDRQTESGKWASAIGTGLHALALPKIPPLKTLRPKPLCLARSSCRSGTPASPPPPLAARGRCRLRPGRRGCGAGDT